MAKDKRGQAGFVPLVVVLLIFVGAVVVLAFMHVQQRVLLGTGR
jgi:flagellar basal body-associated protein FliL